MVGSGHKTSDLAADSHLGIEMVGIGHKTSDLAAEDDGHHISSSFRDLVYSIWHGGSGFDAWLTAATTQIAQVLLSFPYSFAQLGLGSGICYQLLYGFIGCWACYMVTSLYAEYRNIKDRQKVNFENHVIQLYEILGELLGPWWRAASLFFSISYLFCGATIQLIACGSNVYYINHALDKRTWTYIFGICCSSTIFIPTVRNYRIWSFAGITMTSYTAWYLTFAAIANGKVPGTTYSAPQSSVQYFTGATNMLYAFGGHAVTVEIMDAMWNPRKFKVVYLYAILYIFSLTLPSAITVYWAFGDKMLENPNAFAVLPRSKFRDAAVILMILHQFIEFGLITLPIFMAWEKLLGVHTKSYIIKVLVRIPVVFAICFIAVMVPFFGPVNSLVGFSLASMSVYIIPCLAHMVVYWAPTSRKNAIEQPPFWLPSWVFVYCINAACVLWVFIVGTCFGGWASIINFQGHVHSFGLFTKCYQCPKRSS